MKPATYAAAALSVFTLGALTYRQHSHHIDAKETLRDALSRGDGNLDQAFDDVREQIQPKSRTPESNVKGALVSTGQQQQIELALDTASIDAVDSIIDGTVLTYKIVNGDTEALRALFAQGDCGFMGRKCKAAMGAIAGHGQSLAQQLEMVEKMTHKLFQNGWHETLNAAQKKTVRDCYLKLVRQSISPLIYLIPNNPQGRYKKEIDGMVFVVTEEARHASSIREIIKPVYGSDPEFPDLSTIVP